VVVVNKSGGLGSSCELDDDVRDVVTTDWIAVTATV